MRKISIDSLNNMVDSRYSLVTIISKRARQIIDGSEPLIKTNTKKPVGIAIEEFYSGKFKAIYDYDKYKKEKELLEAANEAATLEETEETGENEINETDVTEETTESEKSEETPSQE